MEHEMMPKREDGLAFHIKDALGEILETEEECPGVYYVAARGDRDSRFAREYYTVAADTPFIPQKAKKYGQPIPGCPQILLYSFQEERSGYKIIEYEIARYRIEHKLLLPQGKTLHEIKVFNMELHPEYFGPYPVPAVTPRGAVLRHKVIDNGVYWLETEQAGTLLSVCYPIWTELSDYAMKLPFHAAHDWELKGETPPEYLFFSAHDSCIPVFELLALRDEWTRSGRVKEAALMNAIWAYHPDYAVVYNIEEQAGWHDALGLLLKTLGREIELNGNLRYVIQLTPEEGTDFLHFESKSGETGK